MNCQTKFLQGYKKRDGLILHLTKHMKNLIFFTLFSILSISVTFGQKKCFPEHTPGTFVYDKADILTESEEAVLQSELTAFTARSSNVLVVVIVPDLCGYDKSQYAIEYGDQLGVGRGDKDNGLVFLVKPKTSSSRGEVFIAVGTGLQGAITDAGTRRIVDYEIIPYFKQNNYYGGITAGAKTLMRIAEGEISEAQYKEEKESGNWFVFGFFIVIIILFILAQKYGKGGDDDWENYDRNGKHRGGRGSAWPWIFMGGSGFGGGSSPGGGGFGGGGFGGFGGGGFSGGGAGGSW